MKARETPRRICVGEVRKCWSRRTTHATGTVEEQVWFGRIYVTISEVCPNVREISCQKSVTISATLRSTLLSFCPIYVTITS